METTQIIRAGLEEHFQKKTAAVHINVTNVCNFSCSYCINGKIRNNGHHILDKRILSDFIDDLGERSAEIYRFRVAGGEPLMYPHMEFLIEKVAGSITAQDKFVGFSTNGSLLLAKGERLYRAAGNMPLKVNISVHLEQRDPHSLIRDIVAFGHLEDIQCKILFPPEKLEETKKLLDAFKTHGIDTILAVISQPKGKPYPYTEEEKLFLQEHSTAKEIIFFNEYSDGTIEQLDRITRSLNPDKLNYRGMWCCAGLNALRLGPDGKVARCFGFLRKGAIFDLTECRLRDIPALAEPCRCPDDYCCPCPAFLQTPKWRNPEDAPLYLRNAAEQSA